MKFTIPDAKVSVRVTVTGDCVTAHAGEIRFILTGEVLCLREDYHWTVPSDVVEASGYLALDAVGDLVLLVDELREGEVPFDPSDVAVQILWSVFYMRRLDEGVSFRIYEPTESVQEENFHGRSDSTP